MVSACCFSNPSDCSTSNALLPQSWWQKVLVKRVANNNSKHTPMTSEQTYVSPDNAYQQALDAGQFTIQQCDDCNQSLFYPRNLCPHCGSYAISWITPSGNGTVYATTTVRKRPEKGGNYNVSVIELEEGLRLRALGAIERMFEMA